MRVSISLDTNGVLKTSIAADDACQPSLDFDLVRTVALRFVITVGGIEPDHAAFATEGLQSRFLVVNLRHVDLPIARGLGPPDEGEIAVENAFVDHRIAGDFERIMFAGPQ